MSFSCGQTGEDGYEAVENKVQIHDLPATILALPGLDEQMFRFNERKDGKGDRGRFLTALKTASGRRRTWKELTGDHTPPASGHQKAM